MNFILERNGYPPIIIEVKEREDYLKRLQMADDGEPEPFIELLALKMITDYENVIMSFQRKALEGMEELSKEEFKEIMTTLVWFMTLMREFEVEIPEEAKERIGSIRRFFDMSQIHHGPESPYGRMIGPGSEG
jgi:hypothetical protein